MKKGKTKKKKGKYDITIKTDLSFDEVMKLVVEKGDEEVERRRNQSQKKK